MKILSIDSALDSLCVAITEDESVISEIFIKLPRVQLKRLSDALKQIFQLANIKKEEIELIGATSGPGSFTGIRIAETTAMTAAQILSLPIAPVNTLDAVYASNSFDGITAVAFDARKGEIFTAIYNESDRLSDYLALSPEKFVNLIKDANVKNITGNALGKYRSLITSSVPNIKTYGDFFWYPHGSGIATVSLKLLKSGETKPFFKVRPFYMRRPEAEETREKKSWKAN